MPGVIDAEVLAEVAAGGADDAGGLRVELLGDFLSELADAVVAGVPISSRKLRSYRALGDTAAVEGVALRALLDLYLSAAWRLWRNLPPVIDADRNPQEVVVVGEVMLHAVDDVVAALAEGYQLARRALIRGQESARREFIDDLLTGVSDVAALLERASGFGMDLAGPHAVLTVQAAQRFEDTDPLIARMERAILGSKGDAQALVASKAGRAVVVFPAPDAAAVAHVVKQLTATLTSQARKVGAWHMGVGRTGIGADGVARSYRDCLDALDIAARLALESQVVDARDLLVYRVLLRDRPALVDLVEEALRPLHAARGGAQPLIDTLAAYFAAGGNAAQCARELHMSVRAVTYRLDRVRELTGLDPNSADDRFTLHAAVLGARLLNW